MLEENSATPNHFLTRSRGKSKTSDLGGVAIAVLLAQAPHRARLYGLAADRSRGNSSSMRSAALSHSERPSCKGRSCSASGRSVAGSPYRSEAGDPARRPGVDLGTPALLRREIDELGQWHDTGPPQRCWEAVSSASVKVPERDSLS